MTQAEAVKKQPKAAGSSKEQPQVGNGLVAKSGHHCQKNSGQKAKKKCQKRRKVGRSAKRGEAKRVKGPKKSCIPCCLALHRNPTFGLQRIASPCIATGQTNFSILNTPPPILASLIRHRGSRPEAQPAGGHNREAVIDTPRVVPDGDVDVLGREGADGGTAGEAGRASTYSTRRHSGETAEKDEEGGGVL